MLIHSDYLRYILCLRSSSDAYRLDHARAGPSSLLWICLDNNQKIPPKPGIMNPIIVNLIDPSLYGNNIMAINLLITHDVR